MYLIYTIGRDYLMAIVPTMTSTSMWEPRSFMTFDLVDTEWQTPNSEAHTSTMASIKTYIVTFRTLLPQDLGTNAESIYIIVLIYDFMANDA